MSIKSLGGGRFHDPVTGKTIDLSQIYEGEGDADAVLYQVYVKPRVEMGHTEECATAMGIGGKPCSCGQVKQP